MGLLGSGRKFVKVAVTGATGFIGKRLVEEFERTGVEFVVITRDSSRARGAFPQAAGILEWDPPGRGLNPSDLAGLDGVVNLAGATVAQRWTARAKNAIRNSRVDSTRLVVDAISGSDSPPPVLVSTSAIGFYGPRDSTRLNEDSPPGSDFLAEVCQQWEAESQKATAAGVRVVNPRMGIVLGSGGGAMANMLTPFKLGVGGPIGNGRQWMSWVHIDDVAGMLIEGLKSAGLSGPVNVTAPEPATNRDFSKALGRALHRPAFLPTPVFALRLGFGEFADILATGQRVLPEKALAAGYRFRFPELREALSEVV